MPIGFYEKDRKEMKYCLIPAKSISKRIPGKNFKRFVGLPIWHHAADLAMASDCFHEIHVFTDKVDFISSGYSEVSIIKETSKMTDKRTLSCVVSDYIKVKGLTEGTIGLLLPTAVFVTPQIIRQMMNYSETFFGRTLSVGKKIDKKALNCFIKGSRVSKKYKNKVSQDLPQPYIDAGQFYVIDVNTFLKEPVILGDKVDFFELDTESIDIDTPEDWVNAEALYTKIFLNKKDHS